MTEITTGFEKYLEKEKNKKKSDKELSHNPSNLTSKRPSLPWATDVLREKEKCPRGEISPLLAEYLVDHPNIEIKHQRKRKV